MSSLFKDISPKSIQHIIKSIRRYPSGNIELIEKYYNNSYPNFSEMCDFIISTKIGSIDNNKLVISSNKLFDEKTMDSLEFDIKFVKFLLKLKNNVYANSLHTYLSFFSDDCSYIFDPQTNIQFSDIRNLLINMKIVEHVGDLKYKIVNDEFLSLIERRKKPDYDLINKRKREKGERGEKIALEFEKNRLKAYPDLVTRIRKISDYDDTRGFDIVSYSIINKKKMIRRIEVKTLDSRGSFYLTKNEIEVSKRFKNCYFIYLVDDERSEVVDLIENPYDSIMSNKNENNEWTCEVNQYYIRPC